MVIRCFEGGHLASCINRNGFLKNVGCMEAKNSRQPCKLKVKILESLVGQKSLV